MLTLLTSADIFKSHLPGLGVDSAFLERRTTDQHILEEARNEVMIVHMISGHPYVYLY